MNRFRWTSVGFAIYTMGLTTPNALGQAKWGTDFEAAKRLSATSKKPILIDFMASWCGPCRMMDEETFPKPKVQELLDKVILVRLDVDKNPPQAKQYGVSSIPRLLLLPAGGGQPAMDILGFRDADQFASNLRSSLGLTAEVSNLPKDAPDLDRVRQALQTNGYAALKTTDPAVAKTGLDKLVATLGVTREADFAPAAALIRKAGDDGTGALIRGLNHQFLAVRAGSYRALQEAAGAAGRAGLPPFDPWAGPAGRKAQLVNWGKWADRGKARAQ